MANYLHEHPSVFMCKPKEPHYFSTDFPGLRAVETETDYLGLFDARKPTDTVIGEASVWYLYSSVAADAIHSANPGAKILIMLRRPDEMVPSMHRQAYYSRDESVEDFCTAWNLEEVRRRGSEIPSTCRVPEILYYRAIAGYATQVKRFLERFDPSQVKIILFDDFKKAHREVYVDVVSFLELEDDGRTRFPVINAKKSFKSEQLANFVQRPPKVLLRVSRSIKRSFGLQHLFVRDFLRRLNMSKASEASIAEEVLAEIRDAYRDEVSSLAKLLDRDLGAWLDS